MNLTTLYRAAPAERPYFGPGSYWTTSAEFARSFAEWVATRAELAHLGEHVIYVARVDLAPVRDLREPISSDIVDATVSMWAADGYRWLTFLEHGSAAGLQATMAALTRACRQYVYLGDVAIPAERERGAKRRGEPRTTTSPRANPPENQGRPTPPQHRNEEPMTSSAR